jgi:nicotinamidase-related amidase
VIPDSLFELLDLNHDGKVSRSELHTAAERLGWHWHEAPIFALLDLLTISAPITKKRFTGYLQQIADDPMGPYGRVLLNSPYFSPASPPGHDQHFPRERAEIGATSNRHRRSPQDTDFKWDLVPILEKTAGTDIATGYHNLLNTLETFRISTHDAALLIIDPQRSFTEGVWMQSIGHGAAADVEPIAVAFTNCSKLLNDMYGRMEIMFTRCPFPPGSYAWDDRLAGIIDTKQLYFIKPGNSVFFPRFNGFIDWIERCFADGKSTLVIGGCTLNSCVRVSSVEARIHFKNRQLRIVVDLSICGARSRNFLPSSLYDGGSAVESAVNQMTAAGVQVVRCVEWQQV